MLFNSLQAIQVLRPGGKGKDSGLGLIELKRFGSVK